MRSFIFVFALTATACVDFQEDLDAKAPGDALGTFAVEAELSRDSCDAELLGAPDPWRFSVKLSRSGRTLYWLNGREAIVGDIDSKGEFEFDTRVDTALDEGGGAQRGCTIVRRDRARGELDESEDELEGTLEFSYEASDADDCTPWLGQEGVPATLPCAFEYRLRATRSD